MKMKLELGFLLCRFMVKKILVVKVVKLEDYLLLQLHYFSLFTFVEMQTALWIKNSLFAFKKVAFNISN